jgi:transcriptional regulator with XRE-family HTH domain
VSIEKSAYSIIFVNALKKALKIRGLTQKALAAKINIEPSSLNPYAVGKKDPGLKYMLRVAAALDYSLVDFLSLGEGREPSRLAQLPDNELEQEGFLRVPLSDDMRLAAGGGGAVPFTYEASESPVVVHGLDLKRRSAHNLQAFRLGKGADSMEQIIAAGGLVIADLAQIEPPGKGRDIYVLCWDLHDGECAVKYLSWAEKGRSVLIESENRASPNSGSFVKLARDIKIIGRVIWAWREF